MAIQTASSAFLHRFALAWWFVVMLMAALSSNARAQVTATTPSNVVTSIAADTSKNGSKAIDTYTPGTDQHYLIKVSNQGSTTIKGIAVHVALPADATQASWRCVAQPGARCVQASGTGAVDGQIDLAPGTSVTYEFAVSVPADYAQAHQALVASVQVALPAGYANLASGALTATETDIAAGPASTAALVPGTGSTLGGTHGAISPGVISGPRLGAPLAIGPAFASCGPEMYITQGPNSTTNTTLYRVDTSVIPFTLITLGQGSVPYNAVGFHPTDHYLYGIQIGTNNLLRIASDGSTEVVVAHITNLPVPAQSYNSGEISPDGFFYVMEQGSVTSIYKIDLRTISTPSSIVATRINVTGGPLDGADLAWINGRLYSVQQNGKVVWIDPNTGVVTTLPANNGTLGNVGALFGTPNAFFGSRNQGGFYQFDLTTGEATRLSGSTAVSSNDGAHCASAAVVFSTDVSVTKTNTPAQGPNDLPDDLYTPGTNVTYTIVVTNNGPIGVQSLQVDDNLPPDIASGTWTCTITAGTGLCGAASGTGGIHTTVDLEYSETTRIAAQATFLLTIPVQLNYPQLHDHLTNTVNVTMPPDFVDPTPGNLTATDTDPAAVADLSVVKATSATSLTPGQAITYTLTVANAGPANVTNAVLTDRPDSRLQCTQVSATATCTATGAATCPGPTVSVADLIGSGITIPSLPANNGHVVITLNCRVAP